MRRLLLVAVLFVFHANAVEFGKVQIGKDCSKEFNVTSNADGIVLPLAMNLERRAVPAFQRKICTLRVPIKVSAGTKLQLLNTSQKFEIEAETVKVELTRDISFVGGTSKKMTVTEGKTLEEKGLVIESACGRDAMLAGSLTVLARGDGAFGLKTSSLKAELKTVPCH